MSWNQDAFKRALDFAAAAHGKQTVPGSGAPYVVHLFKVATEVLRVADGSFDVDFAVQCAVLHDCLEDTSITIGELERAFGARVAHGVAALTKSNTLPKAERMPDALRRIAAQPREVAMVKLADRITNLEPAPPDWNVEKRTAYRLEAQTIHDALHAAHAGLAARLAEKISTYDSRNEAP